MIHLAHDKRTLLPAVLFTVAWAVSSRGCVSRSCTDMGCGNGLGATLRTVDGSWPDGTYELSIRADGVETACSFRLPERLPSPPGALTDIDCGPGVRFEIRPETQCESGCDGNACWQRCTPIEGKFVQQLSIDGTPSRLDVSLARDGQELVVRHVEPMYRDVFPNGPECGPGCRQASLELAVP
jgi:hypothetical protein